MKAEKILRRARTMLILGVGDEPFFGSIALGLELVPNKKFKSAATDGKYLWYNPEWIETLDPEQAMGLFEHEVFHVGLKHGRLMREMIEEPDFNNDIWQLSCDQPINERLIKKGRKLPGIPVYDPKYDGMSAVRVYRLRMAELAAAQCQPPGGSQDQSSDNSQEQSPDDSQDQQCDPENQSSDGSQEQPSLEDFASDPNMCGGIVPAMDENNKPVDLEELQKIEDDFKVKIVNANRIIEKSHGDDVPEFVKEIVDAHTKPQRTYVDELMDIMELITRDDYSWSRPNIKYDIYLPSLYEKKAAELVVAVDTSGSVSNEELEVYGGEISGILEEFDSIEITVIYHSTRVTHTETFHTEDLPIKLTARQRGGTCYRDTFAEIDRMGLDPIVMLYFTDLWVSQGNYPSKYPDFPVYWLNTAGRNPDGNLKHSTPPFGTVIDLEVSI